MRFPSTRVRRPALFLQKRESFGVTSLREKTIPIDLICLLLHQKEHRYLRFLNTLVTTTDSAGQYDQRRYSNEVKSQRLELLERAYGMVQGFSNQGPALPIQKARIPRPPQRKDLPKFDAETMLQRHRDAKQDGVPSYNPSQWAGLYASLDTDCETLPQYESGEFYAVHLAETLKHGRYRVIHKLGQGAFSQIWLAKDQKPG